MKFLSKFVFDNSMFLNSLKGNLYASLIIKFTKRGRNIESLLFPA